MQITTNNGMEENTSAPSQPPQPDLLGELAGKLLAPASNPDGTIIGEVGHCNEDEQGSSTSAQNDDEREAESGVEPQNPPTGPQNNSSDCGLSTNNVTGGIVAFSVETNTQNVKVLAQVFGVISMYQDICADGGFGDFDVCDKIDGLIQDFRSLMFNKMQGGCQICTKTCHQISDLSPHLCGKHMGEFILQKSNTGEKSATVAAVENLLDVDERQQQNRFLAMALLRDQGADDEQLKVDQNNTPKQQNCTRNDHFIDNEAGKGEGEGEGEGEEEFHNDKPRGALPQGQFYFI